MSSAPALRQRLFLLASILGLCALITVCALRVMTASQGKPELDFSLLIVTDFINDWTAAHLVRAGEIATIFDPEAYLSAMRALWGGNVEWHTWSYPPHLLLLIPPLAYLDYFSAWFLWSALGLLGYAWVAHRAAPGALTSWKWLWILSPASLVCLLHGQTGLFCATLLLGGLYHLRSRPWLAGVLFGLLTLKPHMGVLLVPLLLMLWQWRAIAAASLTALGMIGLTLALWGLDPWVAYFTTTRAIHVELLNAFKGFYVFMMPGVLPALRILGMPIETAWPIYAAVALPSAIAALWLIKREGLSPRGIFAVALASFLAMPYSFNYDLTIVSLAMGVYLLTASPVSPRRQSLFVALWIAPAIIYFLNAWMLPIVPLLLIAALVLLVRDSWGHLY